MSLEELMNVKITTAARTPEKIGEIPASVVLITRKDIETYGYRTLPEILEHIPGLYAINDYGEGGINFGIRGFWSGVPNDNMIIMVNNVSQVDDFQSNYPLDKITVPVEAIERIEIIRGPMSVIYGNGAFYGAINIITNEALKNEFSKNQQEVPINIFSGSYGSEKSKKIFLRTSDHKGNFKYVLNASIYDTYGMDHQLSKMVRNPSDLEGFGLTEDHRTGGTLEKNEKYIDFNGIFDNFFVNISYNESNDEPYYFNPSFSKGNKKKHNTTNFSFGYKKNFSEKFIFDGKLNYTQSRFNEKYDFLFKDFYGVQQFESNAYELDINTFLYPSKRVSVTTGLNYRAILNVGTTYDLPSFGTSTLENNYLYLKDKNDIVTRSFFSQVNYRPFSNLTLVAGLRLEQMPKYLLGGFLAGGTDDFIKVENTYDEDKIEIIPRFAAIYSLHKNHIFKLLFGQAINRPSFFQNTQNLLLEPGRGSLKPESIQTMELNYTSSLSSDFTFNLSIFRNILENLITRVGEINDNSDYETWSANAGKIVTYGSELTINIEPIENFRIELSGTYQKTDDKRPGYGDIEVAYSPKLLGYLKAFYHTKGFTLALTGNYVGAMDTFWQSYPDGLSGERIGDRVDGYFLLGANIRINNLFIKGLFLNIRCSNLLNEEIRFPTYTNNDWATRGTLGIKRTLLASIGIKF
jgi:outer membrane receptor for ferrienterochelin and colicin